jgi:hypothetical protein
MSRTAKQADELDYRESDGISVWLRWNRNTGRHQRPGRGQRTGRELRGAAANPQVVGATGFEPVTSAV